MFKRYSHFVGFSFFVVCVLLGKLLILAQKCVKTVLEGMQMRRAKGWNNTKTSHKESFLNIWFWVFGISKDYSVRAGFLIFDLIQTGTGKKGNQRVWKVGLA